MSGKITASKSLTPPDTWISRLRCSEVCGFDGAVAIFDVVAGVEPQSETKSFHIRHRYKIEGGGGGASTGPAVSAMVVGRSWSFVGVPMCCT